MRFSFKVLPLLFTAIRTKRYLSSDDPVKDFLPLKDPEEPNWDAMMTEAQFVALKISCPAVPAMTPTSQGRQSTVTSSYSPFQAVNSPTAALENFLVKITPEKNSSKDLVNQTDCCSPPGMFLKCNDEENSAKSNTVEEFLEFHESNVKTKGGTNKSEEPEADTLSKPEKLKYTPIREIKLPPKNIMTLSSKILNQAQKDVVTRKPRPGSNQQLPPRRPGTDGKKYQNNTLGSIKSQSWGESESGYSRTGNVSKQLQFTPKAPRSRTFQSKDNDEVSYDRKTLNLTSQQRRFGAAAADNTATKSNLSQFRKPSLPNSKEKPSPAVRSLDRAARGLNSSSCLELRPSIKPRLLVTPSTNAVSSGATRPKLLRQGMFTCLSTVDIFNFIFTSRSQ